MVERSGPKRKITGADDKACREVAEWMKAIREDGADRDEAIESLENAEKNFHDDGLESADPVPEEEL